MVSNSIPPTPGLEPYYVVQRKNRDRFMIVHSPLFGIAMLIILDLQW